MNDEAETDDAATVPPGEGERRAQRGYVAQYDLGARIVFRELAAGRLHWVAVADRGAGAFDDIVLGLADRITAYQVRSHQDPARFRLGTILLGGEGLWQRMLDSRTRLRARAAALDVDTVYACDDYPDDGDSLVEGIPGTSSAALVRIHEARRLTWSLADWRTSPFAIFIAKLQTASGLDDSAFEDTWRHTVFLVGGRWRSHDLGDADHRTQRRLDAIAALLPRLAADRADRDRWPVSDILSRLGWSDPFELRHGHGFPVDALYQSNAPTEEALQHVLSTVTSGYVSLIGPPGSGKSTLLAAGLLPTPRAALVRYLAFVPDQGQGLGRAEAFDFLHDVVKQLKRQNLGTQIHPGTEIGELRTQFAALLREAGVRFEEKGLRTIIVVDGLDHVDREESPTRSLLCELPLPHAIPPGVLFLLGTQRLDLETIPHAVRDQAGESDRLIRVGPLPLESVTKLANVMGVPDDVGRGEIYSHTEGHPLSIRYVIQRLLAARTSEERRGVLRNEPAYGGDVTAFYQRAWHDLEASTDAREGLAYLALSEGPISNAGLDGLVGRQATDAAVRAAHHLMVRTGGAWSIFHNSFRLFLRSQTSLRHGEVDEAAVRRRYRSLADMARDSGPEDFQRWMELRYRARAGDHDAVATLATPQRFRTQFVEGRDSGDIHDDINLAFAAAPLCQCRVRQCLLET